jgi:hypothetical protein
VEQEVRQLAGIARAAAQHAEAEAELEQLRRQRKALASTIKPVTLQLRDAQAALERRKKALEKVRNVELVERQEALRTALEAYQAAIAKRAELEAAVLAAEAEVQRVAALVSGLGSAAGPAAAGGAPASQRAGALEGCAQFQALLAAAEAMADAVPGPLGQQYRDAYRGFKTYQHLVQSGAISGVGEDDGDVPMAPAGLASAPVLPEVAAAADATPLVQASAAAAAAPGTPVALAGEVHGPQVASAGAAGGLRRSSAGAADEQQLLDLAKSCLATGGTIGDPLNKKGRWADARDEEAM